LWGGIAHPGRSLCPGRQLLQAERTFSTLVLVVHRPSATV
jgi:hypothetical protein